MTGHEGGQGGSASPGDLKLSGVTLGTKEKVGGDKVVNQELGPELLHLALSQVNSSSDPVLRPSCLLHLKHPKVTMLRYGLDLVSSPLYSGPLFPTKPSYVSALSDFITSTSDYLAPSLECNTAATKRLR